MHISPKAYIFDLDGTLFESMDVWSKVDDAFFEKRGISRPDNYFEKIIAMHFDEAAVYTKNLLDLPDSPEAIMQEWLDTAIDAYSNDVDMKPYAREYLIALKAKGAKLAVATSLPTELLTPALHKHGIYHIFDAICTASEVGCGKTKPDIFVLAAKKLGIPPKDCLLYDDILAAVKSAKSIGMKVCGVYDKTSAMHWDEIKEIADFAIHSFKEL
ncbi:MAG: HAD family phosphatase [Defluviitaleaceae bacterium]|nr:HAD family phosphatase [Defluviitaleaceae bacterium]